MRWYGFRIYYYADDKEALILNGIRPAFQRFAGDVEAAFFLRHWIHGPHVRICVRCERDALETVVRPAVTESVGGFLLECPSTRRLVPEEHLPMHRRLAELESETEDLLPWRWDNTIRFTGTFGIDALKADFYSGTSGLAFAMTEAVAAGRQRLAAAFDLMLATAHTLSGVGLARGAISYRSHSDAFLHGFPEGRGLSSGWDEHYRRNAAALTGRVRAVASALDGGGGHVPHVREWVDTLLPLRDRAVADGLLSDDGPPPGADSLSITDLTRVSPFHRELFGSEVWNEQVKAADWFLGYKLMLNCTYLHLTRLGVKPVERFLLCDMAARAVEDALGVSVAELARTPVGEVRR
ncbi:thiopeptide maturation pyridine synthase [Actinomadura litoris]|uniref:thiopeptide maturation pyridine synthase n=1 Tax=Actinomadura litoris TaxID=2678616 RepID=UPI001FA75A52|nr:thiopeptide maturation pyridine synthase [Actinomadura litoris]